MRYLKIVIVAMIALIAASTGIMAQQPAAPPTFLNSFNKVLADQNLKAVADQTNDADVLLGLAYLAPANSPIFPEISQLAANANPTYAPVLAVIAVTVRDLDVVALDHLTGIDPGNALGHYLKGKALYESGNEEEALDTFRKAGSSDELRLYESISSKALFKALDALNLTKRERLCALSWMATRLSSFGVREIQHVVFSMAALSRQGDLSTRKEVSNLLLLLAGHLYPTTFYNREYAQRALQFAFRIKAEVAAVEKSPAMNGYAAVTQALVSVSMSWPGIDEGVNSPQLARELPAMIQNAFAIADPSRDYFENFAMLQVESPETEEFQTAKENLIKTAQSLLEVAVKDADASVGAYLQGVPKHPDKQGPWVSKLTHVEKALLEKPEVFRAGAAYENAERALMEAGKSDVQRRNMRRMMEIGSGLLRYAHAHDNTFPDNLALLYENGYLQAEVEAKSLMTGKSYHYVARGESLPRAADEASRLIVIYDDHEFSDGRYQCVMAPGFGQRIDREKLREQLAKRGIPMDERRE